MTIQESLRVIANCFAYLVLIGAELFQAGEVEEEEEPNGDNRRAIHAVEGTSDLDRAAIQLGEIFFKAAPHFVHVFPFIKRAERDGSLYASSALEATRLLMSLYAQKADLYCLKAVLCKEFELAWTNARGDDLGGLGLTLARAELRMAQLVAALLQSDADQEPFLKAAPAMQTGRTEVFTYDIELTGLSETKKKGAYGKAQLQQLVDQLLGTLRALAAVDHAFDDLLDQARALQLAYCKGIPPISADTIPEPLEVLQSETERLTRALLVIETTTKQAEADLEHTPDKWAERASSQASNKVEVRRLLRITEVFLAVFFSHIELLASLQQRTSNTKQLKTMTDRILQEFKASGAMLSHLLTVGDEIEEAVESIRPSQGALVEVYRHSQRLLLPTCTIAIRLHVLHLLLDWGKILYTYREDLTDSASLLEAERTAKHAYRLITLRFEQQNPPEQEDVTLAQSEPGHGPEDLEGWSELELFREATKTSYALQRGVATLVDQMSQVFELGKLGEAALAQLDTSPMEGLLAINVSVIEAAEGLSSVAAMLARLFDSIGEHELASAIAAMP